MQHRLLLQFLILHQGDKINFMKWKLPSKTKLYEAPTAVADGRVIVSRNRAKVYSSSMNKFYDVIYDLKKKAIMSNDNSSYWTGSLGWPSIATLMKMGTISYNEKVGEMLKGTKWKDINQRFKNNFEKALEYILSSKTEQEKEYMKKFVDKVYEEIKELNLSYLGKKTLPPDGY